MAGVLQDGVTPLIIACDGGRRDEAAAPDEVAALIAGGTDVNQVDDDGSSPLMAACTATRTEITSMLLAAGASVIHVSPGSGLKPLYWPCVDGSLAHVQLLSSYGANRQASPQQTAEEVATFYNRQEVLAWLVASRQWSTPLHHLGIIDADRARALLRDGADLHAKAAPGGPTPLSLAQDMREAGTVAEGSAAQLVLAAAEPWSEANHTLFPRAARELAVELQRLGYLLSRQERFNGQETALYDLWMEEVVPHVVVRG